MRNLSEDLFWDQLLQLMAEGHVVPIVGRDLLKVRIQDRDALLYPLLAQRLAAYFSVPANDLPEGDELNTIVCRYIETGNRIEDVYTALKIVMPAGNELSTPSALAKLASIAPFKLFVTTTFDPLMQRAVDEARFEGNRGRGFCPTRRVRWKICPVPWRSWKTPWCSTCSASYRRSPRTP